MIDVAILVSFSLLLFHSRKSSRQYAVLICLLFWGSIELLEQGFIKLGEVRAVDAAVFHLAVALVSVGFANLSRSIKHGSIIALCMCLYAALNLVESITIFYTGMMIIPNSIYDTIVVSIALGMGLGCGSFGGGILSRVFGSGSRIGRDRLGANT